MQKIRWDWLGPASLVVAIVLGGIQFMDWWSRPSERLAATARFSKVALPAPVKEYISKAYVQAAVSARDKNAAAKSNDQASQSNSANAAEAPVYPLNIEPTYLDNLTKVDVVNSGTKGLENVVLEVTGARIVEISRAGKAPETSVVERLDRSRIVLGTLGPMEQVTVSVWGLGTTTLDSLNLTHNTGIGKIVVPKEAGFFGRIADNWSLTIVLTFTFFLWIMAKQREHSRELKSSAVKFKTELDRIMSEQKVKELDDVKNRQEVVEAKLKNLPS